MYLNIKVIMYKIKYSKRCGNSKEFIKYVLVISFHVCISHKYTLKKIIKVSILRKILNQILKFHNELKKYLNINIYDVFAADQQLVKTEISLYQSR